MIDWGAIEEETSNKTCFVVPKRSQKEMLKQIVSSHHDDESETKNDTSVEVQKVSPKNNRSLNVSTQPAFCG